jgi:hypothetical protein
MATTAQTGHTVKLGKNIGRGHQPGQSQEDFRGIIKPRHPFEQVGQVQLYIGVVRLNLDRAPIGFFGLDKITLLFFGMTKLNPNGMVKWRFIEVAAVSLASQRPFTCIPMGIASATMRSIANEGKFHHWLQKLKMSVSQ